MLPPKGRHTKGTNKAKMEKAPSNLSTKATGHHSYPTAVTFQLLVPNLVPWQHSPRKWRKRYSFSQGPGRHWCSDSSMWFI